MQSNQSTENALCEIKQINQESLQQLLEANNWELSFSKYFSGNSTCETKYFTCRNLATNPCIEEIQIQDSDELLKSKNDTSLTITFSPQGTQLLFSSLNIIDNNYYSKVSSRLKHLGTLRLGTQNHGDISTMKFTLHCHLRSTYAEHAHSIYSMIKKCCNDISQEMWSNLIAILPFHEKTNTELQLENNLDQQFNILPLIPYNEESTTCLANIIDIATQLSEIQQSQYVFYTISENLAKLGFTEQAQEILTNTILIDDNVCRPFTQDASTLLTHMIMNNNGENKRKNSQQAIKYALQNEHNNIADLKHTLSVLGLCAGDETFFYHLLADHNIASRTEDTEEFETLGATILLQAITHMTETIYLSNQAIKELQDENQQQREKINRLEAQLALQNSTNNTLSFSGNVTLASSVNHSTNYHASSKTTNAVTTEMENKTSLPSNTYL